MAFNPFSSTNVLAAKLTYKNLIVNGTKLKTIKKVLVLATALFLGLSTTAFAGGLKSENYFDGIFGQVEVGLGSQTNTITNAYSYSGDGYNSGSSWAQPSGYTGPQYAVALGYSKQIADLEGIHDLNFAATLSYNATTGNTGSSQYNYNYAYSGGSYNGTGYYNVNTKNIIALSLEPGYYLAEQAIAYVKLGWAQGKTTINQSWGGGGYGYGQTTDFGTQSGPLFGFGFKHALMELHDNVFWGLEVYQINMRAKTIADPTCTSYPGLNCTITSKPNLLFGKLHLGYIF